IFTNIGYDIILLCFYFTERAGAMILQTGQRTDIPAFYGQWLINRIREGFVDVRNPYNPLQVTRYPINHEVVDGIAFC
ncbi:hypothetical protein Q604_UNBC16670G0001, partial [human gut metagenome]